MMAVPWCRAVLVLLAIVGLGWSGTMLASGRLPTDLDDLAETVLRGETFRTEDLEALAPRIAAVEADTLPRPAALRGAVVITLHQAETAMRDGRRSAMDERLATLGRLLERALATMPTDPYLWLSLFWYRNTVEGYTPENLPLLLRSYDLGPAEGWIAVRRIRLALAVFPQLSPDLQERVPQEFALLVNSRFPEMPAVLTGAGWAVRDRLVPRLAGVSEESRKGFARSLDAMGYAIDLPGRAPREDRPWTR
ncbi:hypothetical protein PQJ75_08285 [Rhodoplanes sp. TEM]|uniref:Uncharacterized protein n=1 Tax=Rhodoplanes tepidamans TaxID=200616 RepID=A0ABT5JAK5_RHOTP|nr:MULTISPECIES: hypothetical protein [Rhodoplanes]MDC7786718.1 hypothetical protein [Rhodoplanes tepidamans]MDC7983724.1 hypothetical protein [Rhodoplanes sp. TEM]MDQ0358154.1 hypothetical protein [Rhodoplanes tepidamans]